MKVAFISVAIAIGLGSLNGFSRIAPHVACQIWMGVHYAFVENSHDDRWIAGATLPRLKRIHITSGLGTHMIVVEILEIVVALTQVAIVPLADKARVIRFTIGCCTGSLLLKRLIAEIDALAVGIVSTLDAAIGLNL